MFKQQPCVTYSEGLYLLSYVIFVSVNVFFLERVLINASNLNSAVLLVLKQKYITITNQEQNQELESC